MIIVTMTPNIGLKKPDETQRYNIKDFNSNSDILDQEIGKIGQDLESVTSQLAETTTFLEKISFNIKNNENLVTNNDWTVAIQQAINEHKNVFIPDGEFIVSSIDLKSGTTLIFNDNAILSSLVEDGETYPAILNGSNVKDVTVVNPKINGNTRKNVGLWFTGVEYGKIVGGEIKNTGAQGIYITTNCKHITVENTRLVKNSQTTTGGIAGALMTSSSMYVNIYGVSIKDSGAKGIGFTSSSKHCRALNCYINTTTHAIGDGYYANSSEDCIFRNCYANNTMGSSAKISQHTKHCSIVDCYFINGKGRGILLHGAQNTKLTGNTILNHNGVEGWGIIVAYHSGGLVQAKNNLIDGNTIINVTRSAIQLNDASENHRIINNHISEVNQGGDFNLAILTGASTKNTIIQGNIIRKGESDKFHHRVIDGFGTDVIVKDNHLEKGMSSEMVRVGSTGSHSNNKGYKTEERGRTSFNGASWRDVFNIPLTIDVEPKYISVVPSSNDAAKPFRITYNVADNAARVQFIGGNPPDGENNVSFYWEVKA